MSGLGIFLAPIAAILAADYWVTKRKHIDVPGLYRAHGRYRYNKYGTNWRAIIASLVSVIPNIPGMAAQVNPKLRSGVGDGIKVYYFFYLYGFTSAFVVYSALSYFWPAPETLLEAAIYEDDEIPGIEYKGSGSGAASSEADEKKPAEISDYAV